MRLSETLPYLWTAEEKKTIKTGMVIFLNIAKFMHFAAAVDKDSTSKMQMKLYCVMTSCCWQKQKMKTTLGSK